jgi:hypothetical protein
MEDENVEEPILGPRNDNRQVAPPPLPRADELPSARARGRGARGNRGRRGFGNGVPRGRGGQHRAFSRPNRAERRGRQFAGQERDARARQAGDQDAAREIEADGIAAVAQPEGPFLGEHEVEFDGEGGRQQDVPPSRDGSPKQPPPTAFKRNRETFTSDQELVGSLPRIERDVHERVFNGLMHLAPSSVLGHVVFVLFILSRLVLCVQLYSPLPFLFLPQEDVLRSILPGGLVGLLFIVCPFEFVFLSLLSRREQRKLYWYDPDDRDSDLEYPIDDRHDTVRKGDVVHFCPALYHYKYDYIGAGGGVKTVDRIVSMAYVTQLVNENVSSVAHTDVQAGERLNRLAMMISTINLSAAADMKHDIVANSRQLAQNIIQARRHRMSRYMSDRDADFMPGLKMLPHAPMHMGTMWVRSLYLFSLSPILLWALQHESTHGTALAALLRYL